MAAGLLSDPAISLGEQKRAQQLGVIKRSAEQMNRLIQDLLDSATIEAGKLAVELVAVDAGSLISDICESMTPLATQKRQRLIGEASVSRETILADRDRILQVFSNLIGNALKFTPEEGLVRVDALREGSFVRFTVSDNGPGIPAEHLQHLFDRFWQARRERRAGAGLGLAISRASATPTAVGSGWKARWESGRPCALRSLSPSPGSDESTPGHGP
jgi:signal transduction histidine kinase